MNSNKEKCNIQSKPVQEKIILTNSCGEYEMNFINCLIIKIALCKKLEIDHFYLGESY